MRTKARVIMSGVSNSIFLPTITNHLPGSRSTLGMANKALLSNDWDIFAGTARNLGEDAVPNVGFVTLVGSSTGSVDRENTEVVWRETPNGSEPSSIPWVANASS